MITKAPEFTACPYCDGKQFFEVVQAGEAAVTRVNHFFRVSKLVHLVCRECGSVIHTRVHRIDGLLTKAEKEGRE